MTAVTSTEYNGSFTWAVPLGTGGSTTYGPYYFIVYKQS